MPSYREGERHGGTRAHVGSSARAHSAPAFLGEEALRRIGVPLTVVRPTIFMQHFVSVPALYVAGASEFYLPTGDAKVAFLDCRDIAAAAAAVLLGDDARRARYAGRAFELTGPEGVTAKEIAEILSCVAERPIAHVDGADALAARAQALGVSDVIRHVYHEAAGGWFGKVDGTETFIDLTGRRPTSFARFALDHAGCFESRG